MQNYNQNLPHALSIQHTDPVYVHLPIKPIYSNNLINSMYCIHCERNVNEITPEPIVVCGDCIKYVYTISLDAVNTVNKSSAQSAEDEYSESFNRRASKL
jgi:hypothetical protein